MAPTDFDNPRVTARAVFVARGKAIEDLAHHPFVLDYPDGLTPGMKGSLFAQGNHVICPASKLLGLWIRGLDALVPKQRRHEVTHQGQTVAGTAVEFPAGLQMAHGLGCLLLSCLPSPFDLLAQGETFELHPEFQAHIAEDLLDLIERLVAEILGFEHLLF